MLAAGSVRAHPTPAQGWHHARCAEQKLRRMPWDGPPGWAGGGRGKPTALVPVLTLPSVPFTGDESSDLVRHFLIESSAKGVHLKGASEELYFGKDSAVARSSPGRPRSCFQKAPRSTGRDPAVSVLARGPSSPRLLPSLLCQ